MDRNHLPLNITEKIRSRKSLTASVVVLAVLTLILRYADYAIIQKPARDAAKAAERLEKEAEQAAAENSESSASIVAVGNNTFDTNIFQAGSSQSGDWNYDFLYQHIKETVSSADLAIASQTTPLTQNHSEVTGYPTYLSPAEAADGLVNAGFDVIASASCHADDYGSSGILNTLNIWKSRYPDIPVLGIHDSQEDASTIPVLEVNNIRIAFLNYTYGTNTGSLSQEESYMLDTFDRDRIEQAVAAAKSQSDCIIFLAHWGDTDESSPTEYEKQWATYLMDLGVNVIIGTHPMTVQPYGTMSDDEGNETTVFYSLGNFTAIEETPLRILGGMARFTIEKTVSNGQVSVRISDKSMEPLVMHYNYEANDYASYFLSDYTDSLASANSISYSGFTITQAVLQEQFDKIMSSDVTPSTDLSIVNGKAQSQEDSEDANTAADSPSYDAYGGYYDTYGNYYDAYGNVYTSPYDTGTSGSYDTGLSDSYDTGLYDSYDTGLYDSYDTGLYDSYDTGLYDSYDPGYGY